MLNILPIAHNTIHPYQVFSHWFSFCIMKTKYPDGGDDFIVML